MGALKKFGKNLIALSIGILVSLLIAELILNIYNPFSSRYRGNKIQLKTNLKKNIAIEPRVEGLDSIINYSLNELGFRGEKKPEDLSKHYSIITIGGSTTECSLLDDEKTWPAQLGKKLKATNGKVWINNAGLDGASTFGHLILLEDYILKLKPNMAVFLVGINDRGKKDMNNEDGFLINRKESFGRKLIKKSEVANLANNLYLLYKTQKVNIGHGIGMNQNIANADIIPKMSKEELEVYMARYKEDLPLFKQRLIQLWQKCTSHGIKPVFITQPLLRGGVEWEVMELYNKMVIVLCKEKKIAYVDLANELEKKEAYYYDGVHYTNRGADTVAAIISKHLITLLN